MKADIVMANGTKVNVEGEFEDIEKLLRLYGPVSDKSERRSKSGIDGLENQVKKSESHGARRSGGRKGPQELVRDLVEDGFFSQPRALRDVNGKLRELGHIYSVQTVSVNLLRLTKKKLMRRIRENNGWVYVC